ncbi:MAG: phosphate ABC transporter substrate-binding protein, partial [Thermodesulfovibrio sp.]|nr:phosphate ABC transporter substrate-binding protein [Thermodesulfovibrio sp.]
MQCIKKTFLIVASLLVIAGVAAGDEVKIGAGAAPTENVLKPIKEAFEKATGTRLTIISSGPKNGLVDLG